MHALKIFMIYSPETGSHFRKGASGMVLECNHISRVSVVSQHSMNIRSRNKQTASKGQQGAVRSDALARVQAAKLGSGEGNQKPGEQSAALGRSTGKPGFGGRTQINRGRRGV